MSCGNLTLLAHTHAHTHTQIHHSREHREQTSSLRKIIVLLLLLLLPPNVPLFPRALGIVIASLRPVSISMEKSSKHTRKQNYFIPNPLVRPYSISLWNKSRTQRAADWRQIPEVDFKPDLTRKMRNMMPAELFRTEQKVKKNSFW